MKWLQTLELKMDNDSDIKKSFLNTGQIKDLTIVSTKYHSLKELYKNWRESESRPSNLNLIFPENFLALTHLIDYITQLTHSYFF